MPDKKARNKKAREKKMCLLSKECQQGQRHSNDRKRRTNHKSTQEPQRILRPKREHKRRRQRELQHLLLEQLLGFR